ncbi:MAG: DUF3445 domain-containing protein [Asticcacaulis sp.]|nr:DUF3445 domain-containing protein [Asticcacaulis sp.]
MHTPYDGSSKLFTIGLKPLNPSDWIEVDSHLRDHLDEKDRVLARHAEDAVAAEPGTEDAQREVLGLLVAHLLERYPDTYRLDGNAIAMPEAFRRVRLDDFVPPLLTAAHLVQDDLVIMRKGETGWRLAAACLCFPSSWRLREKFGRPIHEVHGPVPGFGEGSRNNELINRMFDNLTIPVVRWNWSLYGDDVLYHPESGNAHRRFGDNDIADRVFFRLERQTLRKLPRSGDILFTIRIMIDPMEAMESHLEGPQLARALIDQLEALTPDQLDYKGYTAEKDRLINRLERIAAPRVA